MSGPRVIIDGVDKTHVEIISFNDLSDVAITSVADNDLIQFNSTSGEWENITVASLAASISLTDLSDVDTTGVSTGDFLQKSAGDWVDFDLLGTSNTWTDTQIFGATNGITIGVGAFAISYTLTFDGQTADGVIRWDFLNDRFDFLDDINMTGTAPNTRMIRFGNDDTFIRGSDTVLRDLDLSASQDINCIIGVVSATIFKISSGGVTIGGGVAGTDYTLTFDGETNDGVLTWFEDEDRFEFADDVLFPDNIELQFGTSNDSQIFFDGTDLLYVSSARHVWRRGSAEIMSLSAVVGVIINDGSAIGIDVRMESNNQTHMFFLDSGNDAVTFGSSTDLAFVGIDGQNDEIQFLVQGFSTQTNDILVVEKSDGTDIFVVDNDNVTIASPAELKGSKHSLKLTHNTGHALGIGAVGYLKSGEVLMTATKGITAIRDGSIVGASVNYDVTNDPGSTPGLLQLRVNGTVVFQVSMDENVGTDKEASGTQARGVDTFLADDTISVSIIPSGLFGGTWDVEKINATLELYYDD